MEILQDTMVESRQELMISPTGEGEPTFRTAHFLKPSITSIDDHNSKVSLPSLSSLPAAFEPKNWPLNVKFHGWRLPQKGWKAWVKKMASLHEPRWRKAGIFEAIFNSTYRICRNNNLVLGVAERWCPETKSFIFNWGEATITLEDLMIYGYSVLGSPVFTPLETQELKEVEEKLIQARKEVVRTTAKKACHHLWLKKFLVGSSEIEHEAFLALWLSRFVLATSFDVISENIFSIAIHLSRGTRIALAPAILASIYRDLSTLKANIVAVTTLDNNADDLLAITYSPFQLVQVWIWERFVALQPTPNLFKIGDPRLAQWDSLACKVGNVRKILNSAKESFNWRPYAKTVQNWNCPMYYSEEAMWVSVDSGLDEELLSFIHCMRVSELVGLDCMEQYLPHRVSMQFGIDQDLPGYVAQFIASPMMAWRFYTRKISDVKCYIPPRLLEADVTTRYLEWWKRSALMLRGAIAIKNVQQWLNTPKERNNYKLLVNCIEMTKEIEEGKAAKRLNVSMKSSKGRKKGEFVSSFEIMTKVFNGAKEGESFSSSFKITPKNSEENFSLNLKTTQKNSKEKEANNILNIPRRTAGSKRKNERNNESACSTHPSKTAEKLLWSSIMEINDSPIPPGFSSRGNRVELRDSNEEDKLKSSNRCEDVENQCGVNFEILSSESGIYSASIADNEAAKFPYRLIMSTEKISESEAADSKRDNEAHNPSSKFQNHSSAIAGDKDTKSVESAATKVEEAKWGGAVENSLGGGYKILSDKAESCSSSTMYNCAPRNSDSVKTSKVKVENRESVLRELKGLAEDASQGGVNGNGDSSYQSGFPWSKLEARIRMSEKKIAELKASRFAKRVDSSLRY